jgi:restriction system protein
MAIPEFEELMRPVLVLLEDGQPQHSDDLEEALADEFSLTPTERAAKLGSQTRVLKNRIAWALHHFSRARLVERRGKSIYAITQRGEEALASHPQSIDVKVCMQYDEWHDSKQTRARKRAAGVAEGEPTVPSSIAPRRARRPQAENAKGTR